MKNVKFARDNYNKILDEFLKKTINLILNSRMNKNNVKDLSKNNRVYIILNIVFFWRKRKF